MKVLSNPEPRDLDGCVTPWVKGPLTVTLEGDLFVPIFSTEEKLRAEMTRVKITNYSVKRIDDGIAFVELATRLKIGVCLDPHRVEGRTRFQLCVPPS